MSSDISIMQHGVKMAVCQSYHMTRPKDFGYCITLSRVYLTLNAIRNGWPPESNTEDFCFVVEKETQMTNSSFRQKISHYDCRVIKVKSDVGCYDKIVIEAQGRGESYSNG